ncbi:MAG: SMI1/KNR4 family protein [Planctomycetota bacterium]|nr:MAG: SMI1/KNR4 family protein [Planctomycetota bacterium]REJ88348.1 MAG: SMI1/KNR4 family protein [Planctomycetota bacterium]REK30690.1 MAG: SMI1/KNR4 family protein [Planctomycetota bacterium]REK33065.1 MAG: SMI1/KNR4 family protein [Planctomycetota bacterium]
MSAPDPQRIRIVERYIGETLPEEYIEYLQNGPAVEEGGFEIHFEGGQCGIRNMFRLDERDDSSQLDQVCRLVADVLPFGALPIAEDWGGNFFCLMLAGAAAGQVVFWEHERDDSDHSVVPVSESFQQFLRSIVPEDNAVV